MFPLFKRKYLGNLDSHVASYPVWFAHYFCSALRELTLDLYILYEGKVDLYSSKVDVIR